MCMCHHVSVHDVPQATTGFQSSISFQFWITMITPEYEVVVDKSSRKMVNSSASVFAREKASDKENIYNWQLLKSFQVMEGFEMMS